MPSLPGKEGISEVKRIPAYNVNSQQACENGARLQENLSVRSEKMSPQVPQIFISYRSEDADFALSLAKILKALGVHIWLDELDTRPSHELGPDIDALNQSSQMLVILSPASVTSSYLHKKVSLALREHKKVIPVLYRDAEVPFELAHLRSFDFRTDYLGGVKALAEALGMDQPVTALVEATVAQYRAAAAQRRRKEQAEQERKTAALQVLRDHEKIEERPLWMQIKRDVSSDEEQAREALPKGSFTTMVISPDPHHLPNDLPIDNVHFTLTGPSVLTPAQAHELLFWVHIEQQREAVLTRASAAHKLPISELSVKSEGPYPLARGSRLSVRLKIKGLNCPDFHKWVTWTGEIGNTAFVVEVPIGTSEGTYAGSASIKLNGCEVAKMSFVVCVGTAEPKTAEIPSSTTLHRTAFASYASQDRAEVLSRVQGMEAADKNLNVFVDVVDLRSGQNWEQELMRRISESDVFYLFWCRHAMASDWVSKEWRLALGVMGEDFIDPIPLEAPQLAPPPKELADKHFNDPLLAFIAAAGAGHS